jgi:GAF domain-containing protein
MLIPMKIRGEVIGVLNVQFDTEHIPPDTQNLITEIADRLSLVMENARLIEAAQQQVEQEQLAAYLTNQIRQSLDLDTVLRTATKEIGETLGLAEVEVRLGAVEFNSPSGGNGKSPSLPEQSEGVLGGASPDMNEEDYEPTN